MNTSLPLIEKYRPSDFKEIEHHKDIIQSLNKFMNENTFPHVLFYGPSGTGKTTTIKCCAKKLYGKYENYMTSELNSSSDRGIDTMRTKVKNFAINMMDTFLPPNFPNKFKIIILDEVDSTTSEAQNMLKGMIEDYGKNNRFCLICNNIDKIDPALQSRCTIYRFPPLDKKSIVNRLTFVCNKENINYDDDSINAIALISNGDMRYALNILDQARYCTNKLSRNTIYKIVGYPTPSDVKTIYNCVNIYSDYNINEIVNIVSNIVSNENICISNLLEELKTMVLSDAKLSVNSKIYFQKKFSECEICSIKNVDVEIILQILVSIFVFSKSID